MANEVALWDRLRRLSALQPRVVFSPSDDEFAFDSKAVDFPFILRHEGEWKLFYTGFDGKTFRLGVASSTDLKNWKRTGLIWNLPEGQNLASAWLLRHNDLDEPIAKLRRGLFWMVYAKSQGDQWNSLELAFSPDLEIWRPFDANPILTAREGEGWENAGLNAPCLIERQHLFWLFYIGQNGLPSLGLALSTDLLVWSRDMENPLVQFSPNYLSGRPFIVRHENLWWLIVGNGKGLKAAFSQDLRRWQVIEDEPITFNGLDNPSSPYFFLSDGKLWLFFAANREGKRHIFCIFSD
ncbi:MAG: hypothetical protein NZ805_05455 [Armatimonadetes bacterium]|nr:hypothetical protein [Armatimonadota bacterium]MDW8028710.1 hypothetical protein [Armatimonadota bacterium]